MAVSVVHRSKEFFKQSGVDSRPFKPEFWASSRPQQTVRLECGSELPGSDRSDGRLSSRRPDLVLRRFPDSWEATFEDVSRASLAVNLPSLSQSVVGLKIAASEAFKPNKPLKLHFVQRNVKTDQIVGGVAIQLSHLR